MKRLRKRIFVTCVILTAAIAAGTYAWKRSQEPRLMDRARYIVNTTDWSNELDSGWLSDHELMYTRAIGSEVSSPDSKVGFYKFDVATGIESPLPGLTKLAAHGFNDDTNNVALSPDRTRLYLGATVAALSGTKIRTLPGREPVCWAGDSSHVIWSSENDDDYIVDIGKRGRSALTKVSSQPEDDSAEPSYQYVSPHRLIVVFDWDYSEDNADLKSELVVDERGVENYRIVHRYRVPLPRKSMVKDIVFDEAGSRIVLRLQQAYLSPVAELMHRYLHRPLPPPQIRESLWVSRFDGAGMHEIGCNDFSAPDGDPDSSDDSVWLLHWLPGDRRISFIRDNVMYTVPAD